MKRLSARPRVAVVGAGAFGGWTALHLARLGAIVVLVDAWGPGNSRSSSGGETRVIRATYGPDRVYSEMVRRAFDLWDSLERSSGETLYVETGTLWMHRGDDGYVRASLPVFDDLGLAIDEFSLTEAAARYPQIDFQGIRSVWFERKAGVLFARRGCITVRDAFLRAGGIYRVARAEAGAIENGLLKEIRLSDGSTIETDAYVFACGPWLGRLFPGILDDWIRPTRQEVFYFGTPAGSERYRPERLPTWVDFGERVVYGIPDVEGRGFKIADDTRGESIDPTDASRAPSDDAVERARRMIAGRFPDLADAPLLESRVCQYENSPDGDLLIDRHPEASNVFFAGGGSGHGFKLSPVVGEIVCSAVLSDKEIPEKFRLDPRRLESTSTQFERRSD